MQTLILKQLFLLLCLLSPVVWCGAHDTNSTDGLSHIIIKEGNSHNNPKGSSIQATINGHALTVVFTENLGQVTIEVSTVSGTSVHFTTTPTPNGVQCFIPNAGDYIVNFTLPNGDEYYGEFTITD